MLVTNPDDSALGALTMTIQRGVPSAHTALKILNDGLTDIVGATMAMYAELTPGSGDYNTAGHPTVDERLGRFQITGQSGGVDIVLGNPQSMGHLSNAFLPTLVPGAYILADVWLEQAGLSAAGGAVNVKFEIGNDSVARPATRGLTVAARGINSGKNQPKSFFISGRALYATPADNKVHAAVGSWLLGGVEYSDAGIEDITLNQNDSAVAALVAGEAYWAAITQGTASTPTTTKGVKAVAASAIQPTPPAGEILLGFVKVKYDAGGGNIAAIDVYENSLTYGRLLGVAPVTGLTLTVHAGESLAADYMQFRPLKGDVILTASVTNRVWMQPNGAVVVTLTAAQPVPGALLLWTAVTDGSHVTTLTDNRVFIGDAAGLTLHAATHATGGTDPVSPGSIGAAAVADLIPLAPLASPALTGIPTAPTAAGGTNTAQLATTAFVTAAVSSFVADNVQVFAGNGFAQPAVLSPAHHAGTLVDVYRNGLLLVEGVGTDYTLTGEQVNYTPALGVSDVGVIRWRG